MKQLFKLFALTLVCSLCCVAVACGSDDSGSSNGEQGGDSSVVEPKKSIEIDYEEANLNVFDTLTLKAETVGLDGTIEWVSSNTDVALVDNGEVFAIEIGTATITASIGEYQASCDITVHNDEQVVPVLTIDATKISLEKNGEYTVNADILWEGKSLPKTYDYTWSIKSGDESKASVTAVSGTNGKQAVIKALDFGETQCYVTAKAAGMDLIAMVDISIPDLTPRIFLTNFSQEEGTYKADISAVDANDGADVSNITPKITVIDNGVEVEDPNVTYSISDNNVAIMEQGVVKAVGVGTTTMTVTYNDEISIQAKINVYRPTVQMSEVLELETACTSINFTSDLLGDAEKVFLRDKEIGTFSGKTISYDLTGASVVLGEETQMSLQTSKIIYTFNAVAYTKVIRTVAEFQSIGTQYDKTGVVMGGYTYRQGYYVLGADLDFNGNKPTTCNFAGTFDGRGYTIENMYLSKTGLFNSVRATAVIKNVVIRSTVLDVSGMSGIVAKEAQNGFTISNVYAEVDYVGAIATTGSMGAGLVGKKTYMGSYDERNIENCVVIADVNGLTADGKATAACFVGYSEHNPNQCADGKQHSVYEAFTAENCLGFIINSGDNTISEIYGSQSYTAETVNAYVLPTIVNTEVFASYDEYTAWKETADISAFTSSALAFIEDAFTNIPAEEVQLTTEGHPDVNMYNATATINLTDLALVDGNGAKLSLDGLEIVSLKVGAKELLGDIASISAEGILTLTSAEHLVNVLGEYRGQTKFVLTANTYDGETVTKITTINIPVTLADYVITTYEEYRQLSKYVVAANTTTDTFVTNTVGMTGSVCTNGYFVLGNDLAFAGKNVLDSTNAKAVSLIGGTFDGQGYTMDQPLFSNSSLFGVIRNGATVKDVKLTNAKVAFGNNSTSNAAIVATVAGNGFEISNVYVDVNLTGNPTKTSGKRFGFIGRQANYGSNSTCLIEDCTMLVRVTGLTGEMSTQMGVWVGDNTDNTYKNSSTSTTNKYATVTMKNCISVITDTNASGYTVSKVGSLFYADSLSETNCGNYASWTEYETATLTDYNADMLAFINGLKPTTV